MWRELSMPCSPTSNPDDFDIEALRQRYDIERDKRLRPEGEAQYIEVSDDFADFYETDPYSPPIEREAISEDIEVAVLGGGFAGLLASYHVQKAGIADFRIIEMGGDFGGTWYWNRYPGVQCDVESYCYIPLLEETNYIPKDRYAYGAEIYEQCQRIGRQFGLYEKALFDTIVRELRYDEDTGRWLVRTNRGDELRARFLILGSGPYNRPKLPGIPGIETFKGHSFHTSRWDFGYTGGDTQGGLVKLADKRVAVIGTGATGIQCIPSISHFAEHLYVLQRTPSAIDIRGNRKTSDEFRNSLYPGWQKDRQANLHHATFSGFPPGLVDLVCDGWTEINRNVASILETEEGSKLSEEEVLALREREDYRYQEQVRRRVDTIVTDPETADKLKAWYRFLCKRPTFSDEYLPVFNRENVTLIDVSGTRGVERITERGFVANGVEYPVDCIIFASGFEITTEMSRRIGIPVIEGRGGLSLYDHWSDGFRTLHGMTTNGFPNLFIMGFIQGGVTVNVSALYDSQALHIAHIIRATLDRGATTVEPTKEAQNAWVRTMRETEVSNRDFLQACTPGYYNNEGGSTIRSHLGEMYGPGFYPFQDLLEEWRTINKLEGMALSQ
jgi:cyclohexanone monooxygenase